MKITDLPTIKRIYDKGGKFGKQCITICPQTKLNVGCGTCEKDCVYFCSHDTEKQIVTCYNPPKKLQTNL
jgi:hypothetical protein